MPGIYHRPRPNPVPWQVREQQKRDRQRASWDRLKAQVAAKHGGA